jgi:hypothetical protein
MKVIIKKSVDLLTSKVRSSSLGKLVWLVFEAELAFLSIK